MSAFLHGFFDVSTAILNTYMYGGICEVYVLGEKEREGGRGDGREGGWEREGGIGRGREGGLRERERREKKRKKERGDLVLIILAQST